MTDNETIATAGSAIFRALIELEEEGAQLTTTGIMAALLTCAAVYFRKSFSGPDENFLVAARLAYQDTAERKLRAN